jgi:hypothetical protein
MVKYQKNDGVFTKIVGSNKMKDAYESFIKNCEKYRENDVHDLRVFMQHYKTLINEHKSDIQLLCKLEEIIMQLRQLEDLKLSSNVKFRIGGRNNEYVYAYALFYRHGMSRNDISDIVGKVEDLGTDIDVLYEDSSLVRMGQISLEGKMMDGISNTRREVTQLLKEKFGRTNNID